MPITDRTFANGDGGLEVRGKINEVLAQNVFIAQLADDFQLANQTASQRLFNHSANGALTLAPGWYEFEALLYLASMSATSGNARFDLKGAGTAVLNVPRTLIQSSGVETGIDAASATLGGSLSTTGTFTGNMVPAATATTMHVSMRGMFVVTTGGTLIPSIILTTAAAAVVKAGSYIKVNRIADENTNASAGWS